MPDRTDPPAPPAAPMPALAGTARRGAMRVVARERLLARLTEARRRRCIVLHGPAGCGKTALLKAWRMELLGLGFDVAWLTLEPADNDLTRWLDQLLGCLADVSPAITRDAMLLADRGLEAEDIERTIIALVRGIAARPRELTLVLDDLHHACDARIRDALQWLVDYAPANLHLVLVSRSAVALSLGRLRDQDLLLELDQRDLRFTADESRQFLAAQLGDIDARDARMLHELADGWVAGLLLFAAHWKRKQQHHSSASFAGSFVRANVQNAGAFAEYFEREVMARISPDEAEFLIRAAACERFCASLCAALCDGTQPEAAMVSLLARLESENLFVVPAEGAEREPWFRLHPLLRETLIERFRMRSEAQQRAVHAAAWHWFGERGMLEEAVRQAVLAGNADAAADLVEQHAVRLITRGEVRKVLRLLRLLPAEQVQGRVELRLLTLRAHICARELDAGLALVRQLEAEIPGDDKIGHYRLAILSFSLMVLRDDTAGAQALLPALASAPDGLDGFYVGARNNLFSWLYMHLGDYEHARRIQTEAQPVFIDGQPLLGTPSGSLNGRCMVGFSYALEGKMIQAERIARDVLRDAEQSGAARAEPEYFAAVLLGEALYEQDDLDSARRLLEDRLDVLERVSIPDTVLRVHSVLAAAQWFAGHRLDAFAQLERLEDYGTRMNLDRLVAHSLGMQVRLLLVAGDYDGAAAILARLDTLAARHRDAPRGSLDAIHLSAERAHVLYSLARDDLPAAAQRLGPLLRYCQQRGWQRHVVQQTVLAAVIAARQGEPERAREYALDALRMGHRLGLLRSLVDAYPGALALMADLAGAFPDPVLAFYVDRLQAASRKPPGADSMGAMPAAAAARPEDELSDREIDVLQLLGQALPNKKIARTLGVSPETVKWHLRNIFRKLDVTSRDEAVARMRDRGLGQSS
ncbi:LuxR C-terminal-related transcriptional regulator [Cupriavidus nantongensis]